MLQAVLSRPLFLLVAMFMLAGVAAAQGPLVGWSTLSYGAGQDVTLAGGFTYVMDVSNPTRVRTLTVSTGAHLVFDPIPVQLTCREIVVQPAALLQIGTTAAPAQGPVVITLQSDAAVRGMLQVRPNGTLELHGQSRGRAWTQLQAHAHIADPVLTVPANDVQLWARDDEVVIAATDFMKVEVAGPSETFRDQTERRFIQSIQGGSVMLTSAPDYDHHGQMVATTVDERAEVGLLNRSIRIQGALTGVLDPRPHVLLGDASPTLPLQPMTAHIEWTESTGLGHPFVPDKYPLHFHRLGDMTGSYVKHCSLHDNHQHGLVVHQTDHLHIEGNVFCDTYGWHLWMQREGSSFSKHNTVIDNLAILARDLTTVSNPTDVPLDSSACFFLTHFDNVFRGNHAASSQASGIWCDTIEPTGWTYYHTMGTFEDNVVHSCGDHGFYLEGRTEFARLDPILLTPPYAGGLFTRLHAYKNNGFGAFWHNFGGSKWVDLQIADNGAGIYPASEGRWEEEYRAIEVILGGKIIGESPGNTGWMYTPAETAYGRSLPSRRLHNLYPHIAGDAGSGHLPELTGLNLYDGLIHAEAIEFKGFVDSVTYPIRGHAGAFAPAAYRNPWAIDPRNMAKACTLTSFPNAPASNWIWFRPYEINPPLYFENANGVNNTILNDMDGFLLGGTGGVVYLAGNPHLGTVGATGTNPNWNAKYLNAQHPFGQAVLYGFAPHNALATVTYQGATDQITPRLIPEIRTKITPQESDPGVYMHAWNLPVKTAPSANLQILSMGSQDEMTGTITLMCTGNATASLAEFQIPYTGPITAVYAAPSYADAKNQVNGAPIIQSASFAAWQAATGTSWFHDTAAEKLYAKILLPASNSATNAYLRQGIFSGAPRYVRFSG